VCVCVCVCVRVFVCSVCDVCCVCMCVCVILIHGLSLPILCAVPGPNSRISIRRSEEDSPEVAVIITQSHALVVISLLSMYLSKPHFSSSLLPPLHCPLLSFSLPPLLSPSHCSLPPLFFLLSSPPSPLPPYRPLLSLLFSLSSSSPSLLSTGRSLIELFRGLGCDAAYVR
jgi:hypothetical protein